MKTPKIWIALILCLNSLALYAEEGESDSAAAPSSSAEVQEYRYVTDKLRLTMYKNSKGSGRIKLLTSGDRLAVLEKNGNYAKVRDDAGANGWVKYSFLQSNPPATQLLLEEKEKNKILSEQIEQFSDTKKLVEDYENTIALMQADQDKLGEKLKGSEEQLAELSEDKQSLSEELDQARQGEVGVSQLLQVLRSYWFLIAIFALLILGLGLFAGASIVESRVKRRFHGVKVW